MKVVSWKVEKRDGYFYAFVEVERRAIFHPSKKVRKWRLLEDDLGVGCVDKHDTLESARATIKDFIKHHNPEVFESKTVLSGKPQDLGRDYER